MIYVTTRPELFSSQLAHSDISSELYHHGIKGQRWGVRRYQNQDGSLTEEGIKRYRKYLYKTTPEMKHRRGINSAIIGQALAMAGLVGVNTLVPGSAGMYTGVKIAGGIVGGRLVGAIASDARTKQMRKWIDATNKRSDLASDEPLHVDVSKDGTALVRLRSDDPWLLNTPDKR